MQDRTTSGGSVKDSTAPDQGAGGGSMPTPPLHPKELRLERITYAQASSLIVANHYLHRMGNTAVAYGVFSPTGILVGVITFGYFNSPHAARGLFGPGGEGSALELTRLWLDPLCRKNSESRVIRVALRLLHKELPTLRGVAAYSDPSVGHIGIVYKASGFEYAGLGPQRFDWVPADRAEEFIQTRGTDQRLKSKKALEQAGIPCKRVTRVRKHRWVIRWQ